MRKLEGWKTLLFAAAVFGVNNFIAPVEGVVEGAGALQTIWNQYVLPLGIVGFRILSTGKIGFLK